MDNLEYLESKLEKTRLNIIKLYEIKWEKSSEFQINNQINNAKEYILQSAKNYGKKAQRIAKDYAENREKRGNIIVLYEDNLKEIYELYNTTRERIPMMYKKALDEEKKTAREEKDLAFLYRKAKKQKDYKDYQKQVEKLKSEMLSALKGEEGGKKLEEKAREIKELEEINPIKKEKEMLLLKEEERIECTKWVSGVFEMLETIEEEKRQMIDSAKLIKEDKILSLTKQNVFQRIIGSVLCKINGASKFVKTAINKAKEQNKKINEEFIPKIKEELEKRADESFDSMKIIAIKAKEKSNEVIKKAQSTMQDAIYSRYLNNGIIYSLENKKAINKDDVIDKNTFKKELDSLEEKYEIYDR